VLCAACRPCRFFEKYLTLADDFTGQPFALMPWQCQVLRDIFGTLDDRGRRIYQDVYLEVPKKNAKSIFVAGVSLFILVAQGRPGQKVYGAATAKQQAGEVFRKAAQMVRRSPELSKVLRVLDSQTGPKVIQRRGDPESVYLAISADGDLNDGINPSYVIRDELHRWRTRKALELAEVLERGMIAREEPLLIDITTAGEAEDEAPLCWRRHEYARQIQEGAFHDPHFYGRVWTADLSAHAWDSREARVQANPSHEDNGGYLKDSVLAALAEKARNDPQARADYLRFHLNIWGQREGHAIDMARWIMGGGDLDLRTWPTYDLDLLIRKWGLADRRCWAGVDASWTTDLTALALVFPPAGDDDSLWRLLGHPEEGQERVAERERRDRVPYGDWIARGFIEATSGNAIDLRAVKDRIAWGAEMFDLQEVCFDPWNFRTTATELIDEGYRLVEIRQGYASLSGATKKLLEIYQDAKLAHGNNPVLNWNAACLALQSDHKDNVQPTKPERAKSSKRIDGISAAVTAMARAMLEEEPVLVNVRSVGG
jgi:phage terminase large subunit-like protein